MNDQNEQTWVLSIAGLMGTVLFSNGAWGPFDTVVGILILLILSAAKGVEQHSVQFIRAYSALYALSLVIIIAPPLLMGTVKLEIPNPQVIAGPNGEDWVPAFDLFLVALWAVLSVFVYRRNIKSNNA